MNLKTTLRTGIKKNIFFGIAHIHSTYNNIIITITDIKGNTIKWSSSGNIGFKGAKRATVYASQATAIAVGQKAINVGLRSIIVCIKGLGSTCESAIRGLMISGLIITKIVDVNLIPHGGCRLSKRRRI